MNRGRCGSVSELKVGMKVRKITGYHFESTIVSVFNKLDGSERVVCESDAIPGLLHIFAPRQLTVVDTQGQRFDVHGGR